jgi:serine/threonine protein phosphatase PrpC
VLIGIEPDADSPDGIHEKINQDRGCVVYPFNSADAVFIVLDGHGEQGDRVSQFVMTQVGTVLLLVAYDIHNLIVLRPQIVISLEKHPLLSSNPPLALKETFVKTNTALMTTEINYMFSGCTCVCAYVRGTTMWVANAGDSRAVMAVKGSGHNKVVAKDLSRDHKPDDPEESLRIRQWGGFVAPPREPGLSARVYLDKECTMIGLAMARLVFSSFLFVVCKNVCSHRCVLVAA